MPVRVLSVWCAEWPVTAAGFAPGNPVIVVRANRVVALSAAAAAEGVLHGQRRRDAQRACPDAMVVAADPERDARAFEPIVAAVAARSTRVEVVEAGLVCIEARGPARFFGGESSLAGLLVDDVRAAVAGVDVRVGIADGRFASVVAARTGTDGSPPVPPGGSPVFLASHGVRWLYLAGEVDSATVDLLARLGLRSLGDLAALQPGDVLARFGTVGRRAQVLASGQDPRVVLGGAPAQPRRVEHRFEPAVDQFEPLVFAAKQAADELDAALARRGRVCTRLVVVAETEHDERTERAWYQATGLRSPAMVDRARWQLAAWTATGDLTAGVVVLSLTAEETRPDDGVAVGLWGEPNAADERATRAVARLVALAGTSAVTVPVWQGGHLPADRYAWVPAAVVDLADRVQPTSRDRERNGPWPGAVPPPLPMQVPADPESVELVDEDGQLVEVLGRGELASRPARLVLGDGRRLAVTGWAGPWPLHENWWASSNQRRAARLQVVDEDGTAHLLLAERRRWTVVGTYR